jgi:hypothetical protein
MSNTRGRKIQEGIRQVLLHDWDPIRVSEEPEAQNEYDSYVGGVYQLLASGASAQEIADHLWEIEDDRMGLSRPDPAALLPVARKLKALDVYLDQGPVA